MYIPYRATGRMIYFWSGIWLLALSLQLMVSHSPPGANLLHGDIRLTMTAQQLNGSQRVLLDGVITDDECRELQRLSNVS